MHNRSVLLQYHVEHTDTNSPFPTNNQFVEQVTKSMLKTSIRIICSRRNATPTLLLDWVIFDVKDGSLNVITSLNLLI